MVRRPGKCSCKPRRRGPMTVIVRPYRRANGTMVTGHRRHKPRV